MQLNGITLTDRWSRPSVNERVAIQAIFLNDGVYVDPYDISACTIFSKLTENMHSISKESIARSAARFGSLLC